MDRAAERAIIAGARGMMMQMQQVRIGQTLTYDDGRPNHRNVKAYPPESFPASSSVEQCIRRHFRAVREIP